MAIVNVPQKTALVIRVQTGVSAAGSPTYASRNYSSVKSAAADADVFAIGVALADLQTYPLVDIQRVNTSNLMEQ